MSALVLTAEIKAEIDKLRLAAEAKPITWAEVQAMATGAMAPIGAGTNHCISIPIGFRCCFSVEYQRARKFRHLSVSINRPGKYPNEIAVAELAKLFGFTGKIPGPLVKIYLEPQVEAVNVMEPI